MSLLLDTNVVSEFAKPRPDADVAMWTASVDAKQLFVSVATLAELRYGVECLPSGRRRAELERWLSGTFSKQFSDHVLPIDSRIAA